MNPDAYTFGIELEYRLKWTEDKQGTKSGEYYEKVDESAEVADKLAEEWKKAHKGKDGYISMESRFSIENDKKTRNYKKWNLVREISLPLEKNDIPMELVSPIFRYRCTKRDWTAKIKEAVKHIVKYAEQERYSVEVDEDTGFHIHVRPDDRDWTMDELKSIAIAVVCFDQPLKVLLPHDNEWTKPNVSKNIVLSEPKNYGGDSASQIVENTTTKDALIKAINYDYYDYRRRDYAWNFTNNREDNREDKSPPSRPPTGTIEFRSPRSTTKIKDIEKWITFTVAFLRASVTTDMDTIKKFGSMGEGGLNEFLGRAQMTEEELVAVIDVQDALKKAAEKKAAGRKK